MGRAAGPRVPVGVLKLARRVFLWLYVCMAVHGAAAPAHQYAPRFLRAARPVARPEAGERARAARGPVAPRAQWDTV